jgi:hypothetical protein
VQKWENAEDHSKVWQIMHSYFTKSLDKLSNLDVQNKTSPHVEIHKLHVILNELLTAVGNLKQKLKSSGLSTDSVAFCFFPLNLGKVIFQMGVLPNHCIESMPTKSREACQLSLQSWQHVLEMLNILRILPESCKFDALDLNIIEVLCGLPWLKSDSKVSMPESKLEWYQHLAEVLQRKLQGSKV